MELVIEIIQNYDDKPLMNFGHEPDNLFIQYYMKEDERLRNKISDPDMGDFANLDWLPERARRITSAAVTNFGIKTFPQFGAYGFYTPKYGDGTSKILAPINIERTTNAAPTFIVTQDATTLALTITITQGVMKYDCFRLMFRDGDFATEFISYDEEFTIETLVAGTYWVSILGYTDEGKNSIVSDPVEYTIL